jgi:hypothetical protein
MNRKPKAIFALDIEARGQGVMSHGIVSIGVCIGHPYQNRVLYKNRFDMLPLKNQTMEPRCMNEFWINNMDKLNKMQVHAKPARDQMRRFRALLDKWHKTHDLYIIADNPGFDFGFVNTYLDFIGEPTLNYKKRPDGSVQYQSTHDSDSYARGFFGMQYDKPWVSNKNVIRALKLELDADDHDHMPENDAELLYKVHMHLVKRAKDSKSSK